jgi:hypothetical protein
MYRKKRFATAIWVIWGSKAEQLFAFGVQPQFSPDLPIT